MSNNSFEPDKLMAFIKEQAKVIKAQSFSRYQTVAIYSSVLDTLQIWITHGNMPIKDVNLMAESIFELNLAIEISYSNYRNENKNLWSKIFGWGVSKIPQIDIKDVLKQQK